MAGSGRFKLEGVFPALVTPFKKDESFNEEAFVLLIDTVFEHVDGFVPCGTTGEFEYMSLEERKRVVEVAVDHVNGKKWVVAGCGAASTRHVVELVKHAEDVGADACLVVAPYFLHPSDKGLFEHYYRVSQATDLPLVLYNIPQTVGATIPRRVVEDLAEFDNIVGLKDSSGDLSYIIEVVEKTRDKNFNVVVGYDEVVVPALVAGCTGMILASAQVYPEVWRKVFDAVKTGEVSKAMELQMSVQKLSRIFCRYGGAVPVKAALRKLGLDVGRTRKPLREGGVLLPEDREEIFLELEKIGKLRVEEAEHIELPGVVEERFADLGLDRSVFGPGSDIVVSHANAGEGVESVEITVAFGPKNSRLGEVFAEQFTYPKKGFEALPAMLEPNLSVRPPALIVPTYKLENLRQANIVYGPAQSSVAKAIVDSLASGAMPKSVMETHLMLVRVSLNPNCLDRAVLHRNIYEAASKALRKLFPGEMRDA